MIRTRLCFMFFLALSIAACTKENIHPTEDITPALGKTSLEQGEELTAKAKLGNFVLLKVENANVPTGSSFCVDVKAAGFQEIVSWQYSIAWDDDVLAFSHLTNFNVPSLTASNFGNPQSDRVTSAWFDPSLMGVTLPRGTALYSICFDAIGDAGDRTFISITDNPTDIEVTNADFETVHLLPRKGRVRLH